MPLYKKMTDTKSLFCCPLCREDLQQQEKTLFCRKGHSYDVAREGYVNLILANQKASREPGDSPEMLRARRNFLNSGYYRRLAENIADIIIRYIDETEEDVVILDAGCGEGYYTDHISRIPSIISRSSICGIDVSREGVKLSAKRKNDVQWGVASVHSIPLPENSVNIILNVFAPHDSGEFSRITTGNGILISVIPGPEHLKGLKEELYDTVTEHSNEYPEIDGFKVLKTETLKYEFTVIWPQIKSDLLKMTPYYWRTKPGRIQALEKSPAPLTTLADFSITVYSKL
ncbi:MAG TPA: methyltransferase domain-containing protein [Spirochaetota bacterium]|nr:methyltransferase domain-containing protein [Spirochaetota bacterium]